MVTSRKKGALTINTTSKKRNDNINLSSGDRVQITCRKEYTNLGVMKIGVMRNLLRENLDHLIRPSILKNIVYSDKHSGKK